MHCLLLTGLRLIAFLVVAFMSLGSATAQEDR